MKKLIKKYINRLIKDVKKNNAKNNTKIPKIINVVLEGGGFNGGYEVGIMMFLRKMVGEKIIEIDKISGVSIGCIVGLLYFLDSLELYNKYYKVLRDCWINNINLKDFETITKEFIANMTDAEFEKVKCFKLYISYFDLQTKQHMTKYHYSNKQELYETIMKSTHIPFLKSREITFKDKENNQFIDGMFPYLFHKTELKKNSKTLYISINHIRLIKGTIITRHEDNPTLRILHGILNCYDLFRFNTSNEFCSYVDDWSTFDITYYRLIELFITYLIHIFILCREMYVKTFPYLSHIPFFHKFFDILGCYIGDIFYKHFT